MFRVFRSRSLLREFVAGLALVAAMHGSSVQAATEAEYDAAYEAMLQNPEDLQAIITFASVATQIGEYETAVGALERLMLFSNDLPTVRADLGFLYYRLGSFEIANYHLQEALNSGRLPPSLEERTRELLDEAQGNVKRHRFVGRINFGARYQTNANAAPEDPRVFARGFLVRFNEPQQEQDDFDAFLIGSGLYSYDLQTQNKAKVEVGMGLALDRFADQDTLHNLTASLNPGLRFEPDPVDGKGLTLYPHLLSRVVQRGDDLLSHSFGAGLQLRWAAREDLLASALVQQRFSDFHNSTDRPTASDRDGHETLFAASARYRVSSNIFAVGRGHAIRRHANRAFNSNFEWGASGRVIFNYSTTLFGGEARQLSSYASLGYRDIIYRAADPGVLANTRRNEQEVSFGLGSTLNLTPLWSVSLEGGASDTASNIRNFDRQNFSISLSASRRF